MFKKLIVTSVILSASSAFAGTMGAPGCPCHQFVTAPYVGLSVGVRSNFSPVPAVYQAIEGTLSGGYAATFNRFYIAGEIFGANNLNSRNYRTTRVGQAGFSNKTTWSYGADILPGYLITDSLLGYLRLGVVESRFRGAGFPAFTNSSLNKTGYQIGGGGQVNITRNWDVRAEYIFSKYNSLPKTTINHTGANQFNVGVVYKFA